MNYVDFNTFLSCNSRSLGVIFIPHESFMDAAFDSVACSVRRGGFARYFDEFCRRSPDGLVAPCAAARS